MFLEKTDRADHAKQHVVFNTLYTIFFNLETDDNLLHFNVLSALNTILQNCEDFYPFDLPFLINSTYSCGTQIDVLRAIFGGERLALMPYMDQTKVLRAHQDNIHVSPIWKEAEKIIEDLEMAFGDDVEVFPQLQFFIMNALFASKGKLLVYVCDIVNAIKKSPTTPFYCFLEVYYRTFVPNEATVLLFFEMLHSFSVPANLLMGDRYVPSRQLTWQGRITEIQLNAIQFFFTHAPGSDAKKLLEAIPKSFSNRSSGVVFQDLIAKVSDPVALQNFLLVCFPFNAKKTTTTTSQKILLSNTKSVPSEKANLTVSIVQSTVVNIQASIAALQVTDPVIQFSILINLLTVVPKYQNFTEIVDYLSFFLPLAAYFMGIAKDTAISTFQALTPSNLLWPSLWDSICKNLLKLTHSQQFLKERDHALKINERDAKSKSNVALLAKPLIIDEGDANSVIELLGTTTSQVLFNDIQNSSDDPKDQPYVPPVPVPNSRKRKAPGSSADQRKKSHNNPAIENPASMVVFDAAVQLPLQRRIDVANPFLLASLRSPDVASAAEKLTAFNPDVVPMLPLFDQVIRSFDRMDELVAAFPALCMMVLTKAAGWQILASPSLIKRSLDFIRKIYHTENSLVKAVFCPLPVYLRHDCRGMIIFVPIDLALLEKLGFNSDDFELNLPAFARAAFPTPEELLSGLYLKINLCNKGAIGNTYEVLALLMHVIAVLTGELLQNHTHIKNDQASMDKMKTQVSIIFKGHLNMFRDFLFQNPLTFQLYAKASGQPEEFPAFHTKAVTLLTTILSSVPAALRIHQYKSNELSDTMPHQRALPASSEVRRPIPAICFTAANVPTTPPPSASLPYPALSGPLFPGATYNVEGATDVALPFETDDVDADADADINYDDPSLIQRQVESHFGNHGVLNLAPLDLPLAHGNVFTNVELDGEDVAGIPDFLNTAAPFSATTGFQHANSNQFHPTLSFGDE